MNTTTLHRLLDVANQNRQHNKQLTQTIMQRIEQVEIIAVHPRTNSVNTIMEIFTNKIAKTSALGLAAAAIITLLLASGFTYATVKTVQLLWPNLQSTTTSERGRTDITMQNARCDTKDKPDTRRYELKKGSGLTAEEGVKLVQAHCELVKIDDVLWRDFKDQYNMPASVGIADNLGWFAGITSNSLLLTHKPGDDSLFKGNRIDSTFSVDANTKYYDGTERTNASTFKPNDTILVYTEFGNREHTLAAFRLRLPVKYYGPGLQQNIRELAPCENNPGFTCVVSNNINHTVLIIYQGSMHQPGSSVDDTHQINGKLIEYDDTHYVLESDCKRVTFNTPYNVFERYNTQRVPQLPAYDDIYAHTPLDDLKVRTGDMIDVYYSGPAEGLVAWEHNHGADLMVERTGEDLLLLRKY